MWVRSYTAVPGLYYARVLVSLQSYSRTFIRYLVKYSWHIYCTRRRTKGILLANDWLGLNVIRVNIIVRAELFYTEKVLFVTFPSRVES